MILTQFQLTQIRASGFDFNAGFLGRLAAGMQDFFDADGMLAAEESAGPLTEIAENYNLLVEVLEGAEDRTTESDQSRVAGIEHLSGMLEELDDFCRAKHGMSIARLLALRAGPDKYDAEFLTRVADAMAEYLRARAALVASGGATSLGDERRQYDTTTEAIEAALASPMHDDPATAAAIERLQALRDELRGAFLGWTPIPAPWFYKPPTGPPCPMAAGNLRRARDGTPWLWRRCC